MPLIRRSYDLWNRLENELPTSIHLERRGLLLTYSETITGLNGGFKSAPARQHLQLAFGIPTELLTHNEIHRLEPALADDIVGGLYTPNDGSVDHSRVLKGLEQAAIEAGVQILHGEGITGVASDSARVTSVETIQRTISVNRDVILLMNASVPAFLESHFAVSLPVWTAYPTVAVSEPFDSVPVSRSIKHDARTLTIKPLPDHRVMISGGWSGRYHRGAGKGVATTASITGNTDAAVRTVPALADITTERVEADHPESVSIDGIPIIDRIPDMKNCFYATGWTGHGYAIAPAVIEALDQWLTSGTKPASLVPFQARRFQHIR